MNILIGGDLVPTEVNIDLFVNGDIKDLIGTKLLTLWNKCDFRIFNLETPLVNNVNPIHKNGPNLIAPTETIYGIKKLNPSLLTLANNHILDQGESGLESTISLLKKHDISYIGAGKNLEQATTPYIFEKNGKKVGVYTCAENEFTIATQNSAGANPFDPLESLDHIEMLKRQCDYVIVLYHGGKEHYRYPSPYLQKVCRKIVQKGADIVVCQHSHCVGSFEEYKGSVIVYGQGNFIFNKHDNEFWNTSILIDLEFSDQINVKYIPIYKKGRGIALATGDLANEILSKYYSRSKEILQEGFIEQKYEEFSKLNIYRYLRRVSGTNKWVSKIDQKLLNNFLVRRKYKKNKKLLAIQNYIECEAHRELFLTGLKKINE